MFKFIALSKGKVETEQWVNTRREVQKKITAYEKEGCRVFVDEMRLVNDDWRLFRIYPTN